MSEYKSLAEWLKEYGPGGVKLMSDRGKVIFTPYYCDETRCYGLSKIGLSNSWGCNNSVWKLYVPPKKKVKKWVWCNADNGYLLSGLMSEKQIETLKAKDKGSYRKIPNLMLEFDDE